MSPSFHQLAPVVVFLFNRPDHASKTLSALKANALASQSELYIFLDGAKNDEDQAKFLK